MSISFGLMNLSLGSTWFKSYLYCSYFATGGQVTAKFCQGQYSSGLPVGHTRRTTLWRTYVYLRYSSHFSSSSSDNLYSSHSPSYSDIQFECINLQCWKFFNLSVL